MLPTLKISTSQHVVKRAFPGSARVQSRTLPPQVVTKFTSASDEAQRSLDVQTHPLWFGSHDDATMPVVTKATRQDVRLIAAFNNQVSKNHLELPFQAIQAAMHRHSVQPAHQSSHRVMLASRPLPVTCRPAVPAKTKAGSFLFANPQEELVCSDPVLARGLALVSVDEAGQSLASASLDMYALPEDEWVCAVDEDAQVHKARVAAFLQKNLRVGESCPWGTETVGHPTAAQRWQCAGADHARGIGSCVPAATVPNLVSALVRGSLSGSRTLSRANARRNTIARPALCLEIRGAAVPRVSLVGETLPNWFVDGKFSVAAKVWLAQRSCSRGSLSSVWDPQLSAHLSGWDLDAEATEQDVQVIAEFGELLRSSHLDTLTQLQEAFGVDPFSWADAQIASGVIPEPEPYMLERFFLSKHQPSNPLPLWYARWGVKDRLPAWIQQQHEQQQAQQQLRLQVQEQHLAAAAAAATHSVTGDASNAASVTDLTPLPQALQQLRSRFLAACSLGGLLVTQDALNHSSSSSRAPFLQLSSQSLHNPLDGSSSTPQLMMTAARHSSLHSAGSHAPPAAGPPSQASSVLLVQFLPADGCASLGADVHASKGELDFNAYLLQQQQQQQQQQQSASPVAAAEHPAHGDSPAPAAHVLRVLCCEAEPAAALLHYMHHSGVVVLSPGEWLHGSDALAARLSAALGQ
ncbi:MAG: hypothetical protein WDW38_011199 [Sanguina aurantia]